MSEVLGRGKRFVNFKSSFPVRTTIKACHLTHMVQFSFALRRTELSLLRFLISFFAERYNQQVIDFEGNMCAYFGSSRSLH